MQMGSQGLRKDRFILCKRCKKKLIRMLPDGRLEFKFGRTVEGKLPVKIIMEGTVKLTCLRADCEEVNVIKSRVRQ